MSKVDLMSFVAERVAVDAKAVAGRFEVKKAAACVYLHRAWQRRDLVREREGGRFVYSLSGRGAKNLDWHLRRAEEAHVR